MSSMMRKPAAAAKAKASSGATKRCSTTASSSQPPSAKRVRGNKAVDANSVLAAQMQRSNANDTILKQVQEALSRAAAAEAREAVAREQVRCARDECREATVLAQQRSERAAGAEGQLKMLREVYDQMHDAYSGSMAIIKSVAAALPLHDQQLTPLPSNEEGTDTDHMSLCMSKPSDQSKLPKTPRCRSLTPEPARAVNTIAAQDGSVFKNIRESICSGVVSGDVSSEKDIGGNGGQDVDVRHTPGPITPMREPQRTPEKPEKYGDRPMTPTSGRGRVPKADATAEVETSVVEKVDPRQVLNTVPWPSTINQWGSLQSKVWAGHSALPRDWLRIWSKSHDAEYYLCLTNRKTTFDIKEVK